MDDGKVTITLEVDAELSAQVTEVLKPYSRSCGHAVHRMLHCSPNARPCDQLLKCRKQEQKEGELCHGH